MKKYIFAIAAIAALMVSCTKENNPGQDGKLSFRVSREAVGTKAELSGTNVVFSAGDKVSVFDGTSNNQFTTTTGGSTANFSGNAADVDSYVILSPYDENASLTSASVVRITIPVVQTATPGGVDPKALISAGFATGTGSVQLKNAIGLVKVVVPDGLEVKDIQIAGGKGQNIAICGTFDFNVDNMSLTVVTGQTSTVVTLVPQDGDTYIAPGTYYVAVRPKTTYDNGFTMAYVNATNQLCKRTTATALDIVRSHIVPLGTLDTVNYPAVVGRATLRYAGDAPQFTGLIKQLAGGDGVANTTDTKIKKIVFRAHSLYSQAYKGGGNVISNTPNTDVLIHAWIDGTTAYVYTEAPIITLYSTSNNLFRDFGALEEVTFNDVNAMANTTFEYMFRNCNSLKKVDFGDADFSNVLYYTNMFFNLPALEYIDFGQTSVNASANTTLMMYNVRNLKTLKLGPNFTLPATVNRMFDATAIQTSIDAGEDVSKKCQLYCSQAFYDSVKDDYDDATAAYSNTYFNKHRFVLNVQ